MTIYYNKHKLSTPYDINFQRFVLVVFENCRYSGLKNKSKSSISFISKHERKRWLMILFVNDSFGSTRLSLIYKPNAFLVLLLY